MSLIRLSFDHPTALLPPVNLQTSLLAVIAAICWLSGEFPHLTLLSCPPTFFRIDSEMEKTHAVSERTWMQMSHRNRMAVFGSDSVRGFDSIQCCLKSKHPAVLPQCSSRPASKNTYMHSEDVKLLLKRHLSLFSQ